MGQEHRATSEPVQAHMLVCKRRVYKQRELGLHGKAVTSNSIIIWTATPGERMV